MTQPATIYSIADIAQLCNVTRGAVCNWLERYDDYPAPAYTTQQGLRYWNDKGMEEWATWAL